uniref:HTH myb-type domain-containing protein n=1 Tax=Guillardia theta TaxID=55529 RepID=A0A7S4NDJ2_GUITH|mmetsp:Transcript_20013/g.66559  ORF Transcript_20013/g.66559 Transcript_20013/m.66559 type:complete len:211 (+) Transcript_20013:265-897(+)
MQNNVSREMLSVSLTSAISVDDAVAELFLSDGASSHSFETFLKAEQEWFLHEAFLGCTCTTRHCQVADPLLCPWAEQPCSETGAQLCMEGRTGVSYARSLLQSDSQIYSLQNHHQSSSSMPVSSLAMYNRQLEKAIFNSSQWSPDEEARFLEALAMFSDADRRVRPDGRRSVGLGLGVARKISEYIGTRSEEQVRSHAQKHFLRQERKNQ